MSSELSPQVPAKPRSRVLVASAAVLALAVSGGAVAGFVWGGGGHPAVAESTVAPSGKAETLASAVTAPATAANSPGIADPSRMPAAMQAITHNVR